MPPVDLESLSLQQVLTLHSDLARELRRRGISRTSNNPTADLAEWIVAKALGLKLEGNSTAGFDARHDDGSRYEIKARRATPESVPHHTSPFRALDDRKFDHAVIVVFEADYSIRSATRLPFEAVRRVAKFRKHLNRSLIYLRDLPHTPEAEDLTDRISAVLVESFKLRTAE